MTAAGDPERWTAWSCTVELTVDCREPARRADLTRDAVVEIRELMSRVAAAVNRFDPDSEISRLNSACGAPTILSPLAFQLLQVALDAASATRGAVDPTVGGDLIRAGYDDDITVVRHRREPGDRTISRPPGGHPGRADWRSVRLDGDRRIVTLPPGVTVDLGATAKAWTADAAARRAHARTGRPVLVSIGGDLSTAGARPAPWGIEVAERKGDDPTRIGLTHGGLATSSVLDRSWTDAAGTARHHIIDPSTGTPADGRWRSASVWAPTALGANIASTWVLVDAASAVVDLLTTGKPARLVGTDGRVTRLGAWPDDPEVIEAAA
ncbi:FAD:protein FMN transferase [Gordonia sp. NPDC003376]